MCSRCLDSSLGRRPLTPALSPEGRGSHPPSPLWGEGRGEGLRRLAALLLLPCAATAAEPAPLRVCADPDNLPYSHRDGSGFENRIARLVADELKRPLVTTWMPHSRGFVRKTLGAGECDLLIGVPAGFERVLPTKPYYRSSYVFVTRAAETTPLRSFDDARLPRLRVGVQLVGDDLAATPPGHALALKGAVDRVTGFPLFGDGPIGQRMVAAVARGELDAAVVWGPQAGLFAQRAAVPLQLAPAKAPPGLAMPFEFAIAMGVRRGDKALRDALNAVIDKRRADIDAILADHAVPRSEVAGAPR